MNKTLVVIIRVFIIAVGLFLLVGAIALNIILAVRSPYENIHRFEQIYYSVISYDINVFIWFCVPVADVFIVRKMLKSDKRMKLYLLSVVLIYTGFFIFRITTLQA